MDALTGAWKQDRSNMAESQAFMKNAGMPDELAQKFAEREYHLTYKVEGNKISCVVKVTNDTSLGEKTIEAEVGKETEIETIDKEKSKMLVNFEGGKFVEQYTDLARGGVYDVTREISGDVMTVTTKMGEHCLAQKWNRC